MTVQHTLRETLREDFFAQQRQLCNPEAILESAVNWVGWLDCQVRFPMTPWCKAYQDRCFLFLPGLAPSDRK